MQFVSGTINLVDQTRFLVGDPSTSANPQWTTQEIKNAINIEYMEMLDEMRMSRSGWGTKRAYATTVEDEIFYQKPSDLLEFISVEVDVDGNNLTTSSSNPIFLTPKSESFAMQAYNTTDLSEPKYYFNRDDHFGIVAPLSTSGTSAIRLTYTAVGAELSADTDEPIIPVPHHSLLCFRAATYLRVSKDLPVRDLEVKMRSKERRFLAAVEDMMLDDDVSMPVAGQVYQNTNMLTGRINRR